MTYIPTDEGWLYLAVVTDLFSRKVVGRSLGERMTRQLVMDALRMAWLRRCPDKRSGLIFHCDRGSPVLQQRLPRPVQGLRYAQLREPQGDCWENACSETLFGSLKVDRLRGMRFETRRAAKDKVIDWLLWYNSRRLRSTLGYISPIQYEQRWLSVQPKTANM